LNEIEDILEDIFLLSGGEKRLQTPVSDLKEFAVALRGRREVIDKLTAGQEIYYQKSVGKDHSYVVIRRDAAEELLKKAGRDGLEVFPVKADDLCVYLTSRKMGGIDSVFDRN